VDAAWLDEAIAWLCRQAPEGNFFAYIFNVHGLLAVVLVSLICGAVGSLVVGNRMAFFSDALAHCAFAGVALGLLLGLLSGAHKEVDFYRLVTPVMVIFGVLVGLGIAYVREKTALASDTVIGVFFAGAIGLGAILIVPLSQRSYFHPENFLFGNLLTVTAGDLLVLFLLAALTAVLLTVMYNRMVFTSFNPSLALSRQVPVRLCNYLFIVLLAMIVNLCLKFVGALLINALLVVPAATAAILCRNMRQLFWASVGLCLGEGVVGLLLSWHIRFRNPGDPSRDLQFGPGGTIVVLSALLFFLAMASRPWLKMTR
jgi:zinc transport system permease protein